MIEFHYLIGSPDVEVVIAGEPVMIVTIGELDEAINNLHAERESG